MRLALAATLLALAAPPPARGAGAPGDFKRCFDAAVALYKSMDFERSLEQLKLAKQQPHAADEDVVASMYEGILRFELGDEAGSASAFRAALFLKPNALMPIPVSPRITLMLERERTRLRQKAPITAPEKVPVAVQARPVVELPPPAQTAQPGPAEPQGSFWTAPPSQRAEDPRPVRIVQAQESIAVPPSAVAGAAVASAEPAVERRLWAIAPMAVGVVGVAAGALCLAQTSTYYDALMNDPLTRSQADTYRSSGKTYQALGWSLLSVGAAAAVAGAVLVALPVQPQRPVTLAPVAGPGMAGVAVSGLLP